MERTCSWRRLLRFPAGACAEKNQSSALIYLVALALADGSVPAAVHLDEKFRRARSREIESVELVKMARKDLGCLARQCGAAQNRMTSDAKSPAAGVHLAAQFPPSRTPRNSAPRIPRGWWRGGCRRWGNRSTVALLEANNRAPRVSCALHDASAARGSHSRGLKQAVGMRVRLASSIEDGVLGQRRQPGAHGGVPNRPDFDSGRGVAGDPAASWRAGG